MWASIGEKPCEASRFESCPIHMEHRPEKKLSSSNRQEPARGIAGFGKSGPLATVKGNAPFVRHLPISGVTDGETDTERRDQA